MNRTSRQTVIHRHPPRVTQMNSSKTRSRTATHPWPLTNSEPAGTQTADGTDGENQDDAPLTPLPTPTGNWMKASRPAGRHPAGPRKRAGCKPGGWHAGAGRRTPHADRGAPSCRGRGTDQRRTTGGTERWLRRIADDPGGLLRRKFLYQYRQRGEQHTGGTGQDW